MAGEEYKNWCQYNTATGMIMASGYCSESNVPTPESSALSVLTTEREVTERSYYIKNGEVKERQEFTPRWSGSTLLNCPNNATLVIHSEAGQTVPLETFSGVVHIDSIEGGAMRVHVIAWPLLEWVGEIEGTPTPESYDHLVECNPFDSLPELIADSVQRVQFAARRAANRARTVGKDDRYAEKRADAHEVVNNPAIDPDEVPYVSGFAQNHELTLLEAAQIVLQKVKEARAAGAKIETAEDAGKAAVQQAQTVRDVIQARDKAVAALESI